MPKEECQSGCGIYAAGENAKENIITGNIIRNVSDCGIFSGPNAGLIKDNEVLSYPDTLKQAGIENQRLAEKLDERYIRSIQE